MRRPRAWIAPAAGAALILLIAGCGREDVGPPQIAYGEAECELCRMIISEEPFAAAAVVVSPEGIRKLAFDDIGCLLDFLRDQPPTERVTAFVHDYQSQAWIDAAKAVFVRSDFLHTPMASHLAACQTRAAADELMQRFAGATVGLDQLLTAARKGREVESASMERSAP